MAFISEEEEKSQEAGMNVLAGADQPQPEAAGSPTTPSQPVSGMAPTPGSAAPQQGSQPQSQAPKGSKGSGMFTDIRKYIKANQPSAQKMAGAVTSGVGQQAGDIRRQLESQQQKFQGQLAQNQQKLQQGQQFAGQTLQTAQQYDPTKMYQDISTLQSQMTGAQDPGAAPQLIQALNADFSNAVQPTESYSDLDISKLGVKGGAGDYQQKVYEEYRNIKNQRMMDAYNKATQAFAEEQARKQQIGEKTQQAEEMMGEQLYSPEEFEKLQGIMTGRTAIDTTTPLDTTDAQMRLKALQGITGDATRATGRDQILRNVFGRDQQYTRGQQALDAALLGATPGLAEQVAQSVTSDVGNLASQVQQARRQSIADLYGAQQQARGFEESRDALRQSLESQLAGIGAEEGTGSEARQARRQAILRLLGR